MNRPFRLLAGFAGFAAFGLLTSLSFAEADSVKIVDMKAAGFVNENFEPVRPLDTFPSNTPRVFCWFKWKNGTVGEQIIARWTYLTERIPVLEYNVTLPRREGSGGVALKMPEGKFLPAGEYVIGLETDKKVPLKAVKFRVLDK